MIRDFVSKDMNKYTDIRELTPEEMSCLISACPAFYSAEREGEEIYLIIGRAVKPEDAGLERRVEEGEALIEVPKRLIDGRRK